MNLPFMLPPELNIYSVQATRNALLAWVADAAPSGQAVLYVSAREVAEIDGAGLQLLAALAKLTQPTRLIDCSEAFAEACRTLGFSAWLNRDNPQASAGSDSA